MAGDARDGRLDHAAHRRAGLRAGVPAGGGADRARGRLRDAGGAAARRWAASCSCARSTSGRRASSRTRRGVTYAHKIEAARPRARPDAAARGGRARRCARCGRTSARGCRCPTAASSACWPPRVDGDRRSRPPAGACAPTASGCCSTATAARSSCSRSGRRAAGRWPPPTGCAGGPDPALDDFWLDPRLRIGWISRRRRRSRRSRRMRRPATSRRRSSVPWRPRWSASPCRPVRSSRTARSCPEGAGAVGRPGGVRRRARRRRRVRLGRCRHQRPGGGRTRSTTRRPDRCRRRAPKRW